MGYLTNKEIHDFLPAGIRTDTPEDLSKPLRTGLQQEKWFTAAQMAGRNFPIACVALEITQRCNLDCSLCYLSEIAEVVKDVPVFELKRRIKMIHAHYGDFTNVQITGGDPTLRSISELVEIVEEIKSYNMRSALFTNGIKASRDMLERLSEAGLDDVVFHVDATQGRKNGNTENLLNSVRLEYINRTEGLPLRVLFNTTIFDGNFHSIPDLVEFFIDHANKVSLASFQMQADTGRGVLRERNEDLISQHSVMALIEKGAGIKLPFDMPLIGHPDCNKYTALFKAGNARTPLYEDSGFFRQLFSLLSEENLKKNWSVGSEIMWETIKACFTSPLLAGRALAYIVRKCWSLKVGLLTGNRPHRISFFIHNFMDAEKLEAGRCKSCVFMVATANGPLSMCVHNAKRNTMISQPVPAIGNNPEWNPIPANLLNQEPELFSVKRLKGRLRAARNKEKGL
ncbi:radical SAM protein [Sneathiella marina]|uniref:Radical SAM protein n=1 Tax=Sneathiella marina TaxID=2950108 RepID=A0ABY4W6U4_9PROT|nr:radical SAM protein [Sneathiella marina]USG60371.1 radical SAM protein [Sneathiella marina]